jgi:4-amino-4-deoxy-L-arabinose transferase-like glycosyltransferase
MFIAAIYSLLGESIFAIRAVDSIVGALLAVIIAVVARRGGGEIVGTLAGITWSLYPMAIFIAGLVYPTGLTAMLLVCAVWSILPEPHQELSAMRVFWSGVFLGLAALTIPVALFTIVVVAVWVLYWAPHSRLVLAFLLFLGSALALAPWTARNFFVHGRLVAIQPSVDRHLPRIRANENTHPHKLSAILQRPDLYAVHFGKQFVRFWELYPDRIKMSRPGYREDWSKRDSRVVRNTIYSPNRLINVVSVLSTGPVFLFAVFGTVALWFQRESRRELSMLAAMVFSFAIGYSFFVGRIRYRIPVEPYIIILSAFGIKIAWALLVPRFMCFLPFRRVDIENVKTITES